VGKRYGVKGKERKKQDERRGREGTELVGETPASLLHPLTSFP